MSEVPFSREYQGDAALVCGFDHLSIVAGTSRLDDGRHYFVMEYLDGMNVAKVVEQVRQVPGVVAASPYIDADGMIRGRAGARPSFFGEWVRLYCGGGPSSLPSLPAGASCEGGP